jgi:hypothetical protein
MGMPSPGVGKLSPTSNPGVFTAISPGAITIAIESVTGNIAFVAPNCDVTDSSGQSINPTRTPTSITFTVVAGKTYHLRLLFDIFPRGSTGTLKEDCAGQTVLDRIASASTSEVFTIVA